MQHLKNLTLASAKHLASQGHITPQHHARIVASVGPKKINKRTTAAPSGFGSLAAPVVGPAAEQDGAV